MNTVLMYNRLTNIVLMYLPTQQYKCCIYSNHPEIPQLEIFIFLCNFSQIYHNYLEHILYISLDFGLKKTVKWEETSSINHLFYNGFKPTLLHSTTSKCFVSDIF